MTQQHCGFVAVLGEPNAGKSTLINQLVGQKVSIVSPKVQTTRQRVLGIAMDHGAQIVLIDTPGIFLPKKRLDRAMVSVAWDAGKDADIVMVLADASEKDQRRSHHILKQLNGRISKDQRLILVLNKVDIVEKPHLLQLATDFGQYDRIEKIFMLSALTGDGVEDLLTFLSKGMPTGPWLFPDDQISDLPQRLWASEITREQLYHKLHQELPYETYVETEAWEEFDNGSVKINQVIYVNRDGQKSIILGKKGSMIKAISKAARTELAMLLDRPVHLFLHVKVAENWAERTGAYKYMGLDFNS
jgi:GTP-binding protein Era